MGTISDANPVLVGQQRNRRLKGSVYCFPRSTERDNFYLTLPSGIQILGIENWVDRIAAEVAA